MQERRFGIAASALSPKKFSQEGLLQAYTAHGLVMNFLVPISAFGS